MIFYKKDLFKNFLKKIKKVLALTLEV